MYQLSIILDSRIMIIDTYDYLSNVAMNCLLVDDVTYSLMNYLGGSVGLMSIININIIMIINIYILSIIIMTFNQFIQTFINTVTLLI